MYTTRDVMSKEQHNPAVPASRWPSNSASRSLHHHPLLVQTRNYWEFGNHRGTAVVLPRLMTKSQIAERPPPGIAVFDVCVGQKREST